MSTGLPVFDTTIQESNQWLKALEHRLSPCTRQHAYGALRAVSHALRDRLPIGAVMGVSAQLPMLLRGVFLEGWRPTEPPTDVRAPQAFAELVKAELPPSFPRQPNEAVEAVFAVMRSRLDGGEVDKVGECLPTPLKRIWLSGAPQDPTQPSLWELI